MTQEVLVTPAIDIQIIFNAEGGRAYTVRFAPVPLDTDRKTLDEALDTVLGSVERQRAKYELEDEEHKLAIQMDRIKKYQAQLVSLDESQRAWWEAEGKRGEFKMSPNAVNERERLNMALNNDRHDAKARQVLVERLRDKVNGHAPDSVANRNSG